MMRDLRLPFQGLGGWNKEDAGSSILIAKPEFTPKARAVLAGITKAIFREEPCSISKFHLFPSFFVLHFPNLLGGV